MPRLRYNVDMQTAKAKKQVPALFFANGCKDWQTIDYLRASVCLPFIALGLSSMHPLLPPMLISFIGLGAVSVIFNFSAGIELDCSSYFRLDDMSAAKKVPLVGLPLLGIALIGFLVGSMFWMGLGLAFLILFGFPAVAVFASFGYLAWISYYNRSSSGSYKFLMSTCFAYSAMTGFYIAAIGGVIRLVPIAIQVQ